MSEKTREAEGHISEPTEHVPDELEEQLDELAETLRDPKRAGRTIEDQGAEGSIDPQNTLETAR